MSCHGESTRQILPGQRTRICDHCLCSGKSLFSREPGTLREARRRPFGDDKRELKTSRYRRFQMFANLCIRMDNHSI
jgi:hypothetical protein